MHGVIHRSTSTRLSLKFVNNFNESLVNACISGLDTNGQVVFVASNGTLIYPSSGGSQTLVKITQNITILIHLTKGELTFYMANTVTGLNDAGSGLTWGFVEFTYISGLLYANRTYVDFAGVVLGMHLATPNSSQSAYGLHLSKIHSDFPWSSMRIRNNARTLVCALLSNNFHFLQPLQHADSDWEKYSEHTLMINSQSKAENVACKASGNQLSCNGDNCSYTKTRYKASDNAIHQAVVPRLCVVFVLSTLLLEGSQTQPQLGKSSYSNVNSTKHYSASCMAMSQMGRAICSPMVASTLTGARMHLGLSLRAVFTA
ncbi:hypothetical protein BGZ63DRAFT_413400 [Mariannaea sp. PMI_226]|nr:hypothetical protein BGZ63DRAFT_413400 [Mariannaea sp. PMI_226]